MAASTLWERLPPGFLKKTWRGWNRLDYEVKLLVVELAERQKFHCAFCRVDRGLIIEHDHEPDQGRGDQLTAYNIRGLACQRCNWHLGLYEQNERGGYVSGWDHVECIIYRDEYDTYIYNYEDRIVCLYEKSLSKTCSNYWTRRLFIDKFDDWKYDGGRYPWYWGFEEIKEKKYGLIRTPKQFIRVAQRVIDFVNEERKKDPNYCPPDQVIMFLGKLFLFLKELIDSNPALFARYRKKRVLLLDEAARQG
jgi:hypothetical protein